MIETPDYTTMAGEFREKDLGNRFEYRVSENPFEDFPHEVFFTEGQVRNGRILKTVAYIVTDEDEYGNPVVEKWDIKHIWARNERGAGFSLGV